VCVCARACVRVCVCVCGGGGVSRASRACLCAKTCARCSPHQSTSRSNKQTACASHSHSPNSLGSDDSVCCSDSDNLLTAVAPGVVHACALCKQMLVPNEIGAAARLMFHACVCSTFPRPAVSERVSTRSLSMNEWPPNNSSLRSVRRNEGMVASLYERRWPRATCGTTTNTSFRARTPPTPASRTPESQHTAVVWTAAQASDITSTKKWLNLPHLLEPLRRLEQLGDGVGWKEWHTGEKKTCMSRRARCDTRECGQQLLEADAAL
jgi:hypothetical protein